MKLWPLQNVQSNCAAYLLKTQANLNHLNLLVLSNEEVIDGVSERGGHPVYRKPMKQWVLKITEYADQLLAAALSTSNETLAPSERPIQLRCISFKDSGQSKSSKICRSIISRFR
jgi:hypothetical protein